MVDEQLRARGIHDRRVLAAMGRIPRERFVPRESAEQAYADRALPIDCDQTISQPYIVGLMSQALELTGGEHVLEIGAGSGYQTAILAELAASVLSIERHAALARQAQDVLKQLGYRNVTLVVGDGTRGWPEWAPYQRIIVAAATAAVPPALAEQLAEGGLVVIPLGDPKSQTLYQVRKRDGKLHYTPLSACRFVPLVAEAESRDREQDSGGTE